MNQEQRKFLIEKITATFKEKTKALESGLPEEPELDKHLIGAVLSKTVKLQEPKEMLKRIEKYVKELNSAELVKKEHYYGRKRKDEEELLRIAPECIFQMPESFIEAKKKYDEKKAVYDQEIKALTAQKDTLILKIQIGSNAILDKLIMQVDSLGDLDIFSNQLSLIASGIESPQKQIETKK